MPAITIGAYELECTDGGEGEPVYLGEVVDSFSGIERNAVRGQRRTFSGVSAPTEEATWTGLRSATANGAYVTCSGALLAGGSITARVIVSAKAVPGTSPQRWIISFNGREKTAS